MAVRFSGAIGTSGGEFSAIAKQARVLSLKPVKRIVFKFDPFVKESEHTRNFFFNISRKSIIKTNPGCVFKANVVCDRSTPTVTFNLENGSEVLFKAQNLTALEMFQLYNKHITSLVPKEEPVTVLKTKSEKAATQSKKKR